MTVERRTQNALELTAVEPTARTVSRQLEGKSEGKKGGARRIVKRCFYFPVTMQKQRLLPDAMTTMVRAAVLAAVLGQFLGPSAANRPAGAHPGHAYFEQPCCGRSHLRHHKGQIFLRAPAIHDRRRVVKSALTSVDNRRTFSSITVGSL